MKITKLAKAILAVSVVLITGLTSTLILATSDRSEEIFKSSISLKQELNEYKIANNSGMSGNENFYNKFKTNRAEILENNCSTKVSDICIKLKEEKAELQYDYKYYHIGNYTKLKTFYILKLEKDGKFLDIKEEAASYLAYKSLNDDFHSKAEAIVYSL